MGTSEGKGAKGISSLTHLASRSPAGLGRRIFRTAKPDIDCSAACASRSLKSGHESRKLAQELRRRDGYELRIVKRKQRSFKVAGLTWIVERSFA